MSIANDLEVIRSSGDVNMVSRTAVQRVANDRGMFALVVWCEDHRHDWLTAIATAMKETKR